MADASNIKILIVDDLPEKLLVYRSILEGPEVELVCARSGAEALRHVLNEDFAVILLDVNMPGMDGYETAQTIRSRRRSAHTPIIFITAHADELHALKGYSYGAVDYILSPVVPDVLRTKVRVFVDLSRLNQQVREQAAQQVALAQREQAHLAALLEKATDFVGRVDVHGRLVHANHAGLRMLGFNEDEASGFPAEWDRAQRRESDLGHAPPASRGFEASLASVMSSPQQRAGLAAARRDGIWFGETTLRARDGQEIPVSQVILAHRENDKERAPVHGQGETDASHLAPVTFFSIIARDISARKRTEAELAQHRVHLEDLVRERTAQLQASHEHLRLTDRLASIGTLAAGLGHDMGNLLLPIRARLDSLQRMDLPPVAAKDIEAIKTAGEYLRRLSQGLRLFALDPMEAGPAAMRESTILSAWWDEVEPFLRNTLPKGVAIECALAEDVPPVGMAPHSFTQVIYNLVQNAGDAMRERGTGRVCITASRAGADSDRIVVSVADDGPGMTEDVRQRCMEPFFTTRTRRISTGLGLALVRGVVANSHGSIDIESNPGRGTTFRLVLPTAPVSAARLEHRMSDPALADSGAVAFVALDDQRLGAYVKSLLRGLDYQVQSGPWSPNSAARLVVLDSIDDCRHEVDEFLRADECRRALVLTGVSGADGATQAESQQIVWVRGQPTPPRIREALLQAVGAFQEASA